MHEADLQGSPRACFVAPTSHVDKENSGQSGTHRGWSQDHRGGWTSYSSWRTLEKPYQTLFTASVLGFFSFSTQRDFSISVDHCLLRFFSLVPTINGSIYYCYHACVPPLCISCVYGDGGQIAYRLIRKSSEHKELYPSLMEGLSSVWRS